MAKLQVLNIDAIFNVHATVIVSAIIWSLTTRGIAREGQWGTRVHRPQIGRDLGSTKQIMEIMTLNYFIHK